jgi:hypothetical protein
MTDKEMAKNLIDTLPDDSTLDDIIHVLYIRAKIEHSEKEILEGKGIPHEEAKKRLEKWLK